MENIRLYPMQCVFPRNFCVLYIKNISPVDCRANSFFTVGRSKRKSLRNTALGSGLGVAPLCGGWAMELGSRKPIYQTPVREESPCSRGACCRVSAINTLRHVPWVLDRCSELPWNSSTAGSTPETPSEFCHLSPFLICKKLSYLNLQEV